MLMDRRRVMAPKSGVVYGNFGGYIFAPGPIVYENGQARIQERWNEISSYGSWAGYGLKNGSTYFNFVDLGQLLDSRGSSFNKDSGDINNGNPLSFDEYNNWIVPTADIYRKFLGVGYSSISRNGSTVNGNTNVHYSKVQTNMYGYGGWNYYGYIVFPDDKIINGIVLSYFDDYNRTAATGVSESAINQFIKQGCIFMPVAGYCMTWDDGSSYRWQNGAQSFPIDVNCWTATSDTYDNAVEFSFTSVYGKGSKDSSYKMCWLCRQI